jgi:AcrR family transcriptional regulator
MLGSSLYAHVDSKQDLLVEVVEQGARLFQDSARRAQAVEGSAVDRLRALVSGHVDVVLANHDVVRTFLNEARMLDEGHRTRVIAARDGYEQAFREVVANGVAEGSFRPDVDAKMSSIYTLSVLNALERWYRPDGDLDRDELTTSLVEFVESGLT